VSTYQSAPPSHVPSPAAVSVVLYVWGIDAAKQDRAASKAKDGWGRRDWQFVEVERLTGDSCPLDVEDGASIAGEAGPGWAYVVYVEGKRP
jgi:hypothetical protein